MRRFIAMGLLTVVAGLVWDAPAHAQYGGGYGYGPFGGAFGGGFGGGYGGFGGGWGGNSSAPFGPNIYNPQTQPLSPYLNLLGNNPAVNYFYRTRPGLPAGGFGMPYGISPGAFGRFTFFPQIDTIYEQTEEDAKSGDGMRPTGHVFGFNNTLGYFGYGGGYGMGLRNQGQSLAGQSGQTRGVSGIR